MSLIFINALSFSSYSTTGSTRYSKTLFTTTTTANSEANKDMIPVTGVMLGLGILATILVIAYLICLCRVTASRLKRHPTNQIMGLQQPMGAYPQPYPPNFQTTYPQSFSTSNPVVS